MNFSSFPNNSIGKLLRTILNSIPPNTQVRILQGRLRGRKWIVGSSVNGCWLGSYELDKQKQLGKTLHPGDVVYDLGANVGFYTLLSSEIVGPEGKVIAFEPLPRNIVYLRKHVEINHFENVVIVEAAVSNISDEVFFCEGPDSSTGRLGDHGSICVKTIELDNLFANGEIPAPDIMKIDIEGGEFLALKGASQILEKFHPIIFLATHGENVHHDCLHLLALFGYELRSLNHKSLEETDEIIAIYR